MHNLGLSNTKRTVKDNMTLGQRKALKALGTWNKDPSNPRMFRIQDKGFHLVIEWKHKYKEGILKYLEDINIFKERMTTLVTEICRKLRIGLLNGMMNVR